MIYLVKYGEFEVTKHIRYTIKNEEKDKNDCMKYLDHVSKSCDSICSSKKAKFKKPKPQIGTFRIALVGKGQMFGEEDVIKEYEGEKRVYTTSVKCISPDSYVFCMKYDEFLRKFKLNG